MRSPSLWAVLVHDVGDSPSAECYGVFRDRETAVDLAKTVVMTRAVWQAAEPLSHDDWRTPLTGDEVRGQIDACGIFCLASAFTEFSDGSRVPEEYVEVTVAEVTNHEV